MSKTIAFVCRVVVMLAFLIAIPLIALFGKSLPDVAETVWGYWKKPAQENQWADTEEAPPFKSDVASPLAGTDNSVTPNTDNPLLAATNTPDPSLSAAGSSSLSPYVQPSTLPQNHPQGRVAGNLVANSTPITVTPAQPYGSQPFSPQPSTPMVRSQAVPTQQNSAFEQISQRLQDLGATYYRLELWGNGRPLFRFQCRVAMVGSAGLTRQFEATDQDPAKAMRQVLDKVEAWRQQPQNPPSTAPASNFSNVPAPNVSNVPNAFR